MSKYDIYLYEDCKILKNLLNIKNEEELDLAEAELSRANMMILYEEGFSDFSTMGIRYIHKKLFEDVYEWAGKFIVINIQKREKVLAGRSVWYTDCDNIEKELDIAWSNINSIKWQDYSKDEFVELVSKHFATLWQIHPFREGNTRTIVMLMTFFVEHYGYYFDQELIAHSAGYFRDALVMASLEQFSEYEHLEKILNDAICTEPIEDNDETNQENDSKKEKYEKYKYENYKPSPHEYVEKTND